MLRRFGLGNRETWLNSQDRRQKLQTKKTGANGERRSRHSDRSIAGLGETGLDHIAPIMSARVASRLTTFRGLPMRDFRCD